MGPEYFSYWSLKRNSLTLAGGGACMESGDRLNHVEEGKKSDRLKTNNVTMIAGFHLMKPTFRVMGPGKTASKLKPGGR